MESTIVRYIEIQGMEAEAEKLRKALREIPERISELDASLAGLEGETEALRAEVEAARERIAEHDRELKKLKALNESNAVRGKKARNQREYKAFEKDAKTIETRTSEEEEKSLTEMGALDSLVARLKESEDALPAQREKIVREREALEKEMEVARVGVEKSDREVNGILETLPPDSVARYRKAAENRPGRALAAVDDSTCLACHMNIPPQLYNELHKNDKLMTCPHCHRIMYIRKNPAFGYVAPEENAEDSARPKKGRPKKSLEQGNAGA
jgi:predicted  nucleic acid-binding Zn-ribbon protein